LAAPGGVGGLAGAVLDLAGFSAATISFEALFSTVVPLVAFSTVALLEALFAFSLPTTMSFILLLELWRSC
jgi:hypothetical protein